MCGEGRALPKEIYVFYLDYGFADEDAMEEKIHHFKLKNL